MRVKDGTFKTPPTPSSGPPPRSSPTSGPRFTPARRYRPRLCWPRRCQRTQHPAVPVVDVGWSHVHTHALAAAHPHRRRPRGPLGRGPAGGDHGGDRRAHPGHRGRSADPRRPAPQRAAVFRAGERAAARARRAATGRQRRVGARGRQPAGPGAFRRAHGLQRHGALSRAGRGRVHPGARHAVRRARERAHELRRDGVPAADSHRPPRRDRSVDAHHGGLGAQRLVRGGGRGQGARRRPRGVAAGPGCGIAPARRADADSVEGRALRRSIAHRPS